MSWRKRMNVHPKAQIVQNYAWEFFKRVNDIAAKEVLGREAYVLHGIDGEHMDGSLHYVGLAWDSRVWINPFDALEGRFSKELCYKYGNKIQQLCGPCFDVVVHESKDKSIVTHIHTELDFKSI